MKQMKHLPTIYSGSQMARYLIGLFLIGWSSIAFSQTPEWHWQSPLPQGNSLNNVKFVDSETGWAVGVSGTVLKTRNSGLQWDVLSSGTTAHLYGLHFLNAQNGWTAGQNGTILKTTNGGQNWIIQPTGTKVVLRSVWFTDQLHGWAVGDSSLILRTTNGGNNWQKKVTGTTSDYHNSVCFVNSQLGWVVGSNAKMFKTSDGGTTWTSQLTLTSGQLKSVQFVTDQTGFAAGYNNILLKTTNGGDLWKRIYPVTNPGMTYIHFVNENIGWGVGATMNQVFKTTNGGLNWLYSTEARSGVDAIFFTDEQRGYLVGAGGVMANTTNGGIKWNYPADAQILESYQDIQFTDTLTGFASGYGILSKTTNGGKKWENLGIPTTEVVEDIHFVNSNTGYYCGQYEQIQKTTNGGLTWTPKNNGIGQSISLHSLYFTDSLHGWCVGQSGLIFRTKNGGESWTSIYVEDPNMVALTAVFFTDSLTGFAIGNNGPLFRTFNGGDDWFFDRYTLIYSSQSIFFINEQIGWIAGNEGKIKKTTDGGQSWQQLTTGTTQYLNAVHFSDPLNGFAAGTNKTFLQTTNGGQTWQPVNFGLSVISDVNSVYTIDSLHSWAVADVFAIISTFKNNSPETHSSLIQGQLLEKTDTTCLTSTIPAARKLVKAMPGPYYGISQADGSYNLRVPVGNTAGNYTLSAVPFGLPVFSASAVCPPGGLYNISPGPVADTITGKDFGYDVPSCHHLEIQVASSRRRRCFRNLTSVNYTNQGNVAATDAYVLIEFPKWVKGISATVPFTAVSDSVWKCELGTVAAGTSGQFSITDSVVCGFPEIRNLMQCTRATIFPASDCPAPGNWNGAELAVFSRCDSGKVRLAIHNRGLADMVDSTLFTLFLDSIQVRTGKAKLASGDSLFIFVQAQNRTVSLSVNQVANHPREWFISTILKSCGSDTNTASPIQTNHFPKSQTASSKTHCLPIIDSFDPNDKKAFPLGFTSNHIVKPGTEMEYLIRFQNTGTDTAFSAMIIDTLDTYLNVESLEIGSISHPCQVEVQTTAMRQSILRFLFKNLLLPDSSTNEAKSHGFVQFRISPKPGLAMGTQVHNRAAIIFDFNPPVITNETLTTFDNLVFTDPTLDSTVQVVSVSPHINKKPDVQIFPNPAEDLVTVVCGEKIEKVVLVDVLGIETETTLSAKNQIHIEKLKSGMYWLKIETRSGLVAKKLSKL